MTELPVGAAGDRAHGNTITRAIDRLDLMCAFAGTKPEYADAWVDNRLLGLSLDEIGAAEGIGRGGAFYRVKMANAAIRRYVEHLERTQVIA